jgi:nucleolar complex protein 3
VTQLAVYKDVIPGYRIRSLTLEEQKIKVGKEVRRVRGYEQALVSGYQAFVQDLGRLAKAGRRASSKDTAAMARIAISCACSLLVAVPHFNFRGDLLKIIVDKLSTKGLDETFSQCLDTLIKVFRGDDEGRISRDAITLLTKMIKAREYNIQEQVLNTFLHLRVLTEFKHKASQTKIDRKRVIENARGKRIKKDKAIFRTKKQKKLDKHQKVVEKEMKEADAVVTYEERDAMQAETLKMVFVTYFRILKARIPRLMGAVLEGLAKYAHLINQDFFGDLLEALKDLIAHSEADNEAVPTEEEGEAAVEDELERNTSRQSLLCVVTAFALLHGQDTSHITGLSMDLSYFTTYLYRSLLPLSMDADIEFGKRSLRLADPDSEESTMDKNINVSTTTVLLLKSLSAVLLPAANSRAVPPKRVSAFTKTTLTSALHFPEKSTQATLGLFNKVAKMHGRKMAFLWNTDERKGDGVFDGAHPDPEGCNSLAASVWETELLGKHFSPGVREEVKLLNGTIKGIM